MPSPPSGKGKGPANWEPSPPAAGPSRSTANGTSSGAAPSLGYTTSRYSEESADPFRDPAPDPPRGGQGGSGSSNTPPRLAADPYHPGFGAGGTTQSYLNRQDSAMDKLEMHGAS